MLRGLWRGSSVRQGGNERFGTKGHTLGKLGGSASYAYALGKATNRQEPLSGLYAQLALSMLNVCEWVDKLHFHAQHTILLHDGDPFNPASLARPLRPRNTFSSDVDDAAHTFRPSAHPERLALLKILFRGTESGRQPASVCSPSVAVLCVDDEGGAIHRL